jgi:Putative DNA-binding domain
MSETTRTLDRIQRWMQAVITHPGGAFHGVTSADARQEIDVPADEVERVIPRSRALPALERLQIYAGAYFARLLECLRDEFPVLRRAVGEDLFDDFAFDYLQRHPSRSYTLTRLGAHFARFLDETRPPGESWADLLVDLAALEWAVGEVFDGPGVEGQALLDADRLLAVPLELWPEARLVPVPCLRTLALRYPLRPYYIARRDDLEAPFPERSDSFLALTRRGYVVRLHDLSRVQFVLLNALRDGRPLGEAIGLVAEQAGPDLDRLAADLRDWFRDWATAGFFQAVDVPGDGG